MTAFVAVRAAAAASARDCPMRRGARNSRGSSWRWRTCLGTRRRGCAARCSARCSARCTSKQGAQLAELQLAVLRLHEEQRALIAAHRERQQREFSEVQACACIIS